MKFTITALALIFSANVFALEASLNLPKPFQITSSPLYFSAFSSLSYTWDSKEAEAIINESQDFLQTGRMSPALSTHLSMIQDEAQVSESEALDILLDFAESILAK